MGHNYKRTNGPIKAVYDVFFFFFFFFFFLNIFVIYSHGGHLGHVTLIIYATFHSLFLRMLHIKFGFDWPSGFREEDVRKCLSYTCI